MEKTFIDWLTFIDPIDSDIIAFLEEIIYLE